jgi:hypothetical protein
MIKQSCTAALALSLCLTAGCSRAETGDNSAQVAVTRNDAATAPATAPPNDAAAAADAQAPAAKAVVALDPGGLRAVDPASGSTRLIAFGSPADQAVEALSRLFGARPREDGVNEECGGGPARIVQWANGLGIQAEEGRFTGWQSDKAGLTTMNGIGVGSTRAELDAAFKPAVDEFTLGTEFAIGEGDQSWGGLLSGPGRNARIEAIWAGGTCHFR